MKNIETLMKKASELKAEGLVEGQISEELNISSETVTWLLTHVEKAGTSPGPKDISVNWSMIGKSAFRLSHIPLSLAFCDAVCYIGHFSHSKEYLQFPYIS